MAVEGGADGGEGGDFLDVLGCRVRAGVDEDAGADGVWGLEGGGEEGVFVCGFEGAGVGGAGYEVWFGEEGAGPGDAEEGRCCV